MFGYIYKTTNLVNGKIYIGQKKSDRFLGNKYLGSGKILCSAINKYGADNFIVEMLEECMDVYTLNDREMYWISFYHSQDEHVGYNIAKGGSIGHTKTDEWRRLVSQSLKGHKGYWTGKKMSDEHKNKISIGVSKGRKGLQFTEQHRQNLSIAHLGQISRMKGCVMSDIAKEKMKTAHLSKYLVSNEDTRRSFYITPNELDSYLCKGYHRGRLFK